SRTHEGTGIGLSLVRELVQLHGGSIRIESEVGRGSRFIVVLKAGTAHLPAEQVSKGAPADEPGGTRGRGAVAFIQEALSWLPDAEGSENAPRPTGDKPTPRARLLLADDNVDMRRYITRLLQPYYDVATVPDGQAALEAARSSQPDLILSD